MAEVIFRQVKSTVQAMDSEALLDARTLTQIVEAVMQAMEEREAQQQRQRLLTRVGPPNRNGDRSA